MHAFKLESPLQEGRSGEMLRTIFHFEALIEFLIVFIYILPKGYLIFNFNLLATISCLLYNHFVNSIDPTLMGRHTFVALSFTYPVLACLRIDIGSFTAAHNGASIFGCASALHFLQVLSVWDCVGIPAVIPNEHLSLNLHLGILGRPLGALDALWASLGLLLVSIGGGRILAEPLKLCFTYIIQQLDNSLQLSLAW